jgi:hypothetical protein
MSPSAAANTLSQTSLPTRLLSELDDVLGNGRLAFLEGSALEREEEQRAGGQQERSDDEADAGQLGARKSVPEGVVRRVGCGHRLSRQRQYTVKRHSRQTGSSQAICVVTLVEGRTISRGLWSLCRSLSLSRPELAD